MPMESFFLCDFGSLGAATGTGAAMLSIHTSLNGFSSASARHSLAYTTVPQPGQKLSQHISHLSLLAQCRICCWTAMMGTLNWCAQQWKDQSCMYLHTTATPKHILGHTAWRCEARLRPYPTRVKQSRRRCQNHTQGNKLTNHACQLT